MRTLARSLEFPKIDGPVPDRVPYVAVLEGGEVLESTIPREELEKLNRALAHCSDWCLALAYEVVDTQLEVQIVVVMKAQPARNSLPKKLRKRGKQCRR